MPKKKESCRILSQTEIAAGIFDLRVESSLAESAVPGQFAGLYVPNSAKLLPRPVSICDADAESGSLRFVYRVTENAAGGMSGTAEIACLKGGDSIEILGLLGNGYDLSVAQGKKAVLLGGGIGVPPMLYLAKKLTAQQTAVEHVMGYRNAETFLSDEFRRYGELHIATDDGSVGTHGSVIDVLKKLEAQDTPAGCQGDEDIRGAVKSIQTNTVSKQAETVFFACGPKPMLKALKDYTSGAVATKNGQPAPKVYISLEERMACGIGVCLGCVAKTVRKDPHSGVHNARVCTDGPVFEANEVDLS